MDQLMIPTANELEGYRVTRQLGVARSILGNLGASLQTILGGITLYTELAEKARQKASDLLVQHAQDLGANAIIAMRYDSADGVTEVLAYGAAIVVEPC